MAAPAADKLEPLLAKRAVSGGANYFSPRSRYATMDGEIAMENCLVMEDPRFNIYREMLDEEEPAVLPTLDEPEPALVRDEGKLNDDKHGADEPVIDDDLAAASISKKLQQSLSVYEGDSLVGKAALAPIADELKAVVMIYDDVQEDEIGRAEPVSILAIDDPTAVPTIDEPKQCSATNYEEISEEDEPSVTEPMVALVAEEAETILAAYGEVSEEDELAVSELSVAPATFKSKVAPKAKHLKLAHITHEEISQEDDMTEDELAENSMVESTGNDPKTETASYEEISGEDESLEDELTVAFAADEPGPVQTMYEEISEEDELLVDEPTVGLRVDEPGPVGTMYEEMSEEAEPTVKMAVVESATDEHSVAPITVAPQLVLRAHDDQRSEEDELAVDELAAATVSDETASVTIVDEREPNFVLTCTGMPEEDDRTLDEVLAAIHVTDDPTNKAELAFRTYDTILQDDKPIVNELAAMPATDESAATPTTNEPESSLSTCEEDEAAIATRTDEPDQLPLSTYVAFPDS